jgi:hypothetical protein
MVQVSDHDAIAKFIETAEQTQTVGAAGHTHHDSLTRGEELLAADEFRNSRSGIHGRGIIASRSSALGRSPTILGRATWRGILWCWPRIAP